MGFSNDELSGDGYVRTIYVNLPNPNTGRLEADKLYFQFGKKDEIEEAYKSVNGVYVIKHKKGIKNADGSYSATEPFAFRRFKISGGNFGESEKFEFFVSEDTFNRPMLFSFNIYSYKSLKVLNAFAQLVTAKVPADSKLSIGANKSEKGILYTDINIFTKGIGIVKGLYATEQLVKWGVYKNDNKADKEAKLHACIDKLYDIVSSYYNSNASERFANVGIADDAEEQQPTFSNNNLDDTPPERRLDNEIAEFTTANDDVPF